MRRFLTQSRRTKVLRLEAAQFQGSRRSSAWLEQRSFKPMVQGSNPCAGTRHFFGGSGTASSGQRGADVKLRVSHRSDRRYTVGINHDNLTYRLPRITNSDHLIYIANYF